MGEYDGGKEFPQVAGSLAQPLCRHCLPVGWSYETEEWQSGGRKKDSRYGMRAISAVAREIKPQVLGIFPSAWYLPWGRKDLTAEFSGNPLPASSTWLVSGSPTVEVQQRDFPFSRAILSCPEKKGRLRIYRDPSITGLWQEHSGSWFFMVQFAWGQDSYQNVFCSWKVPLQI